MVFFSPGLEWSAEHKHGDGLVPLYCSRILWLLEIRGGNVINDDFILDIEDSLT